MQQVVDLQKRCATADKTIQDTSKQLKSLIAKSEDESLAYMRRTKAAENRVRELVGHANH